MTMVVSNRQRIFYRFEGDKGAYLLLHHGLFGSHQDWYRAGYVDGLRDEFRVIVMDARGHGRSDHPLEAGQYTLAQLADDVVAIMDELEIRNLHFCGYSLGALVGFELLMRHPERVRIVMLAGESPFISEAMQVQWRELAAEVQAQGLGPVRERLVAGEHLAATSLPPEQEGETQAAVALLEALAAEPPRPDEGRLSVDSPVALFTGEADPALERMRDARRRIHRARFVSFPGLTHAALFHERETLTGEMMRLLRPGRRAGSEDSAADGARRSQERSGGDRRRQERSEPDRRTRPSPPLTPPPPVEVPTRRSARERDPARNRADPAPAERVSATATEAAPAGPAAPSPAEGASPAGTPQAAAHDPAAPRAGVAGTGPARPTDDDPPVEAPAPDDVPVRARMVDEIPAQDPPPADEAMPLDEVEAAAPTIPGRAAAHDAEEEEDELVDWRGAEDDEADDAEDDAADGDDPGRP